MVDELLKKIGGGIDTVARAPEVYQKGLLFEEYFWPVSIVVLVVILLLVTIIILQIRRSSGLGNNRIRICPSCGVQNPVNSQFCSECGEQFYVTPTKKPKPKTRVCPHCGAENPADDVICDSCEKDMRVTPRGAALVPLEPKAPKTAAPKQAAPPPVAPKPEKPTTRPRIKKANRDLLR